LKKVAKVAKQKQNKNWLKKVYSEKYFSITIKLFVADSESIFFNEWLQIWKYVYLKNSINHRIKNKLTGG
jgi:hypothetical protein